MGVSGQTISSFAAQRPASPILLPDFAVRCARGASAPINSPPRHVDNLAKFDELRRRMSMDAVCAPQPVPAPPRLASPEVQQFSGAKFLRSGQALPYELLPAVTLTAEQVRRVPDFDWTMEGRPLSAYARPIALVRNVNVAHVCEYEELMLHWTHTRCSPFDGTPLLREDICRVA